MKGYKNLILIIIIIKCMQEINKNQIIGINITKVYGNKKKNEAEIVALDNVSFSINKGELVVILGPSGAGKSTLINILGGMENSTSGKYYFFGDDVSEKNEKELADFRKNKIGFIFQFYNLIQSLNAYENVYLAASLLSSSLDSNQILDLVGLKDRKKNFPSQLSGGEQQRVAIARALVKNPDLLLADEPTGALDSKTGSQILDLLYKITKENNKTVIIVTHNKAISVIADRIIMVSDGKIIENITVSNPKKPQDIEW